MTRGLHWFWREVLVGIGVAEGLFFRLTIAPTREMLVALGDPSEVILTFLFFINIIPVLLAIAYSYDYGHLIGILSLAAAGWSGFILPSNPEGALFVVLVSGLLALIAPVFREGVEAF